MIWGFFSCHGIVLLQTLIGNMDRFVCIYYERYNGTIYQ